MKQLILAVVLLTLMSGVRADEPYDFQGLKLGTELNTVEAQGRWLCRNPDNPIADTVCFLDAAHAESIAGVAAQGVMLRFYDGQLSSIVVYFPEGGFGTVLSALKEKYGRPTEEKNDVVSNRAGAKFENHEVVWSNATSTITASGITATQRTGRVDLPVVSFDSADILKKFNERRDRHGKQGAKDI